MMKARQERRSLSLTLTISLAVTVSLLLSSPPPGYAQVFETVKDLWVNGNAGMGTTAPAARLDIKASGTTSGFALRIADSLGSDKLVVQDNGYVGIGTTSPLATLNLLNDQATIRIAANESDPYYTTLTQNYVWLDSFVMTNVSSGNSVTFLSVKGNSDQTKTVLWGGNEIEFGTNTGDTSMLINRVGNVGIGTSTPQAKLEVRSAGSDTNLALHVENVLGQQILSVPDYGYVGIGTTYPSYKLDVNGDINATGSIFTTGTLYANVEPGYFAGGWMEDTGISTVRLRVPEQQVGIGINVPNAKLHLISNFNTGATFALIVASSGPTERMVVTDDGNVGIGVTNPIERLEVSGGIKLGNTATATDGIIRWNGSDFEGRKAGNWASLTAGGSGGGNPGGSVNQLQYNFPSGTFGGTPLIVSDGSNLSVGTDATGNASRLYVKGAGTTAGFALRIADSLGADRLVVLDKGNVGIGTTNPAVAFQVVNGDIRIDGGNSYSFGTAGSARIIGSGYGAGGDYVGLHTNWTRRLTVDNSGNVGIATTAPSARLDIRGTGTTSNFALRIADSAGTDRLVVLDKGNVGIGSTAPSAKLSVDGTFKVNIPGTTDGTIFSVDTTTGITAAQALQLGSMSFEENAGIVSWIDMIVSTTAPSTVMSYTAQIDSTPIMTIFSTTDGAGGVTNLGVGINNLTPAAKLDIYTATTGTSFVLRIASTASSQLLTVLDNGKMGLGTSNPSYTLHVAGTAAAQTLRFGTLLDNILPAGTGTNGQVLQTNASGVISWATATGGGGGWNDDGTMVRLSADTDNVGIGRSDPDAKLHIFGSGTTSNFALRIADSLGSDKLVVLDSGNVGLGTTNPIAKLSIAASGTGTGIVFKVKDSDGIDKFTITDNGNTGIGLTDPLAKLSIMSTGSNTGFTLKTKDSAGNNKFVILDNGNVGVGTTAPAYTLHMSRATGNTGPTLALETADTAVVANDIVATIELRGLDSGSRPAARIRGRATGTWGADTDSAGTSLEFFTQDNTNTSSLGAPRMVIHAEGNVGIGTTNPAYKFQIQHDENWGGFSIDRNNASRKDSQITFNQQGAELWTIGVDYYGNNTSDFFIENVGYSPPRIYIDTNGNVGIYATSPSQRLHVSGGNALIEDDYHLLLGTDSDTVFTHRATAIAANTPVSGLIVGTPVVNAIGSNSTVLSNVTSNTDTVFINNNAGNSREMLRLVGSDASVEVGSGATAMVIDNNGNVGIGTTAPAYDLDVSGDGRFTGNVTAVNFYGNIPEGGGYVAGGWTDDGTTVRLATTADNVGIGTSAPGSAKLAVIGGNVGIGTTNPTDPLYVAGNINFNNATARGAIYYLGSASTAVQGSGAGLGLKTNYVERLTIDDAGNIGISNTAPLARLDIRGTGTTSNFALRIADSLGADKLVVLDKGNVGIGTTEPGTRFEIEAFDPILLIDDPIQVEFGSFLVGGAGTGIRFSDSNRFFIGTGAYSTRNVMTFGIELFTILNSGNVGIGTTAPAAKLDVAGEVWVTGSGDSDFSGNVRINTGNRFTLDADDSADSYLTHDAALNLVSLYADNAGVAVFTSSGNVGIATTNPGQKLDVAGQIKWNGNILPSGTGAANQILIAQGDGTINWQTALPSSVPGGSVNQLQWHYPANTLAGASLIVTDGYNLSVGTGETGNASRLYVKGAGTATGFALRIADSAAADRLVVLDNGNVGIGITEPTATLHVNGTLTVSGSGDSDFTGNVSILKGKKYILDYDDGSDSYLGYDTGDTFLSLFTDNKRVAAFGSDGNVGISKTNPSARLDIRGTGTATNVALRVADSLGADQLVVLDNGYVGIGTSPDYKLHVQGGTIYGYSSAGSGYAIMGIGENASTAGVYGASENSYGVHGYSGYLAPAVFGEAERGIGGEFRQEGTIYSTYNSPTLSAYRNNTLNSYDMTGAIVKVEDNTASSGHLIEVIKESSTEFVVDNAGNVGIGTSVPVYDLDVTGNGRFTGNVTAANFYGNIPEGGGYVAGGWVDDGSRVRLSVATDNVGIGRSDPGAKLHIFGSGTTSNFALRIADSLGADKLVVLDSGNVGIGKTNPTHPLDIGTTIDGVSMTASGIVQAQAFSGTNNGGWALSLTGWPPVSSDGALVQLGTATTGGNSQGRYIGINANAGYTGDFVEYQVNGTREFSIGATGNVYAAGNVGISTTAPNARLDIRGSGTTSNFALKVADSLGADKLVVLDKGNVGIGTTAPTAKLSVDGDFKVNIPDVVDGTVFSVDTATGITTADALQLGSMSFEANAGIIPWIDLPVTTTTAGLVESYTAQIDSNPLLTLYSVTDGSGGVTNLRVGINNLTPAAKLDIYTATTGTGFVLRIASTSSSQLLAVLDNGNTGLGTSNPSYTLHVAGTAAAQTLRFGTLLDNILPAGTGTNGQVLQTNATGVISWGTVSGSGGGWADDGSVVRLSTETDSVGIGGSATTTKLYIQGSGTTSNFALRIADSAGTDRLVVLDKGNVGIGTTNPINKFEVYQLVRFDATAQSTYIGTMAGTNITSGTSNTAVGDYAMVANTEGAANIAVGMDALGQNTDGDYNIAVGSGSLYAMDGGSYNTAVGDGAMGSFTAGDDNTAVGSNALTAASTAGSNTVVGSAGLQNATGSGNTVLGWHAGDALSSGSNNIIIGYDIDATSDSGSNQLTIGNLIFGTGIDGTGKTVSSGNVGIASTAPNARLHIVGTGTTSNFALRIADSLGTDRLVVLDRGNVGIGTTAPTAKLSVDGDFKVNIPGVTDGTIFSVNTVTGVTTADTLQLGSMSFEENAGIVSWIDMIVSTTAPSSVMSYTAQIDSNPLLTLYSTTNGSGGVTNLGVGINNVTPAAKLDIYTTGTGTALTMRIANTSSSQLLAVLDNGNTGLGTSNPSYTLHVAGTAAAQTLRFGTLLDNILPAGTGANNQVLQTNATGVISWGTVSGSGGGWVDDGSTVRLDTSGDNVGIGTSSPQAKVEVKAQGTGTGFALKVQDADGNDKMVILDNGNVGIGTTNPGGYKLYINSPYSGIQITGLNDSASRGIAIGSSTAINGKFISLTHDTTAFSDDVLHADLARGTGSFTGNFVNFQKNNATQFLVDAGGNTGIGVTAPSARLEIRGSGTTSNFALRISDSLGTDKLAVLDNGNVGIGTTNPQGRMDLGNGTLLAANGWNFGLNGIFYSDYGRDQLDLGSVTSGGAYPWRISSGNASFTGGYTAFNIDGVEKIRITGSGLGIGTTAPLARLDIRGSGTTSNFALRIADSLGADKLVVLDSGNVGIGTTSPAQEFVVTGTVLIQDRQNLLEGFEGGGFPPTSWTTGGDANWARDTVTKHTGSASAASGAIGDDQSTWIDRDYTFPADGFLKFYWKVSSEADYDYLVVCIDNDGGCAIDSGYSKRISGEVDWTKVSLPVSAGAHSFRWLYGKDGNQIGGSDKGWIDDVQFNAGGLLEAVSWSDPNGFAYSNITHGEEEKTITFSTNNTDAMFIGPTGNVGIGTITPGRKLHVEGGDFEVNGGDIIFGNGFGSGVMGAGSYSIGFGRLYADDITILQESGNVGIGTGTPETKLQLVNADTGPSDTFHIKTAGSNTHFALRISNTVPADLLVVLDNGNVGIGISAPAYDLDVTGNGRFTGNVTAANFYGNIPEGGGYVAGGWVDDGSIVRLATTTDSVGIGASAANTKLYVRGSGTTANFALRIADSLGVDQLVVLDRGNVGVGTTAPAYLLHLSRATGNTGPTLALETADAAVVANDIVATIELRGLDSGSRPAARIRGRATGTWGADTDSAGTALEFFTQDNTNSSSLGTARMVIGATGNVGIGTTNPSSSLEVIGDVTIASAAHLYFGTPGNAVGIRGTDVGFLALQTNDADRLVANWGGPIQFKDESDNERMRIELGGNVGIATTAPVARLEIWGTGTSSNFALRVADSLGTDRLAVMDNGNVGVGVTNPDVKLYVSGAITASGAGDSTFGGNVTINTTNRYVLDNDDSADSYLTHNSATNFVSLFVDNTRAATFTDAGNLGIGTSAPSYSLHVAGTAAAQTLRFGTLLDNILPAGTGTNGQVLQTNATGVISWATVSGSGGGWADDGSTVRLDTSGDNVGIGTSSPQAKVEVKAQGTGTGFALKVQDADGNDKVVILDKGNVGIGMTNPGYSLEIQTSDTFAVHTNARMYAADGFTGGAFYGEAFYDADNSSYYVDPAGNYSALFAGNVGIATTTPSARLDIRGSGTTSNFALRIADSLGVDKLVVLDRGNVGIGITSPISQLHVFGTLTVGGSGDSNFNGNIALDVNNRCIFDNNSGADSYVSYNTTGANMVLAVVDSAKVLSLHPSGNVGVGTTAAGARLDIRGLGTTTNFALRIADSLGIDRLVVLDNGRVGIGTSAPGTLLDVAGELTISGSGDSNFSGNVTVNSTKKFVLDNELGADSYITYGSGPSAIVSIFADNTRTATFASTGNVGIGYTVPSEKLYVAGNIYATGDIACGGSCGGGAGGGWADDGSMVRLSADTDNVGIGRSDPAAKLHIFGSGTTSNFALRISDSLGADRLVVLDNGNMGIGTTNPSGALQVGDTYGFVFANDGAGGSPQITANVPAAGNLYFKPSTGYTTFLAPSDVNPVFSLEAAGSASTLRFRGYTGGANGDFEISTGDWNGNYAGSIKLTPGLKTSDYTSRIGNFSIILSPSGSGSTQILNGNVGIATTAPLARLDIRGTGTTSNFALRIADSLGADRLVVLDKGNVGIGTTAPTAKLSVDGNFKVNIPAVTDGTVFSVDTSTGITYADALEFGSMTLEENAGIVSWIDMIVSTTAPSTVMSYTAHIDSNPLLTLYSTTDGSGGVTNLGVGINNVTPAAKLDIYTTGTGTALTLRIANTSSSQLLAVLDNGNVGIGTSAPAYDLDVTGDGRFTGSVTATNFYGNIPQGGGYVAGGWVDDGADIRLATTTDAVGIGGSATSTKLYVRGTGTTSNFALRIADSLGADKLVVLDKGNVGIGTTSPIAKLSIAASGTGTGIAFKVKDSDGIDKFTITDNGNTGIGLTDPLAKLSIMSSGSNTGFTLKTKDSAGNNKFVILDNGNVGIGTTAPATQLHVRVSNTNTNGQLALEQASTGDTSLKFLIAGTDPWFAGVDRSDAAKFKIASTAGMLGNILRSGFDNANRNMMSACKFTMPGTGGTAASISVYVGDVDTAPNDKFQMAIYTDNAGAPDTKVAETAQGTLTPNAWNALSITASLSANTTYWLVYNSNSTNDDLSMPAYHAGTTNQYAWKAQAFGTYPSSYGTPDGYWDGEFARFVLYTATSGDQFALPKLTVDQNSNLTFNGDAYAGGNVGIGTTTPVTKLHLVGTRGSADAAITMQRVSDDYLTYIKFHDSWDAEKWAFGYTGVAAGFPSNNDFALWQDGDSAFTRLFIQNGGNVGIGTTNPTYKLEVAGSISSTQAGVSYFNGNVGIGTVNPSEKLYVNGNIYATGDITCGGSCGGGSTGWADDGTMVRLSADTDNVGIGRSDPGAKLHIFGSGTTSNFALRIADSAGTDKLVVLDKGNVGIGTTAPQHKLDVAGDLRVDSYIYFNGYGALRFGGNASAGLFGSGYGGGSDWLGLVTEDIPRVFIAASGNVGIGLFNDTTLPFARLHIIGSGTSSNFALRIADSLGADKLVVLDKGNVGIGTTSPYAQLHVYSSANSATAIIETGNLGSDVAQLELISRPNTAGALYGSILFGGDGTDGAQIQVIRQDIGGGGSETDMAFLTDSDIDDLQERMRITNAGNVGIGTSAPSYTLHVAGTAAAQTLRFGTLLDNILPAGTGTNGQVLQTNATGVISWGTVSGSGGGWADDGTMVRLSADTDNVGIGRSDPGAKLHIFGSGTTAGFALRIADSLGADRLVVLDRGNVGIGTTAPGAPLVVSNGSGTLWFKPDDYGNTTVSSNNTIRMTVNDDATRSLFLVQQPDGSFGVGISDSEPDARLEVANAAGTFPTFMLTRVDDGDQLIVTSAGNVGIGMTDPGEKLQVAGNIKLSGQILQGGLGDLAEMMTVAGSAPVPEPAEVVIVGEDGGIRRSSAACATNVVGIISTSPAQVLRHGLENAAPVVLSGIVPCRVTAENGAIIPGDLLVTSSTPGHAMAAGKNPAPGTVIGKALSRLDKGKKGTVQVLVMLR